MAADRDGEKSVGKDGRRQVERESEEGYKWHARLIKEAQDAKLGLWGCVREGGVQGSRGYKGGREQRANKGVRRSTNDDPD